MTTTINNEHKKLNVPNLRFKEFQGEWEKCKLGDICAFLSGGTPKIDIKEYWDGTIPFVSAISMHNTYISDSNLHISEKGLKNGSKLLKKNNLLLLVRGSMLWKSIPVCLIESDVAFNQDVKGIIPNDTTNNKFLLYWLKAKEQRLKYMVTGTGLGAGKLDTNDLLSMSVYAPSMNEQDKIAKLLSLLDERIATQNKIIDKLQSLIKGIAQKIVRSNKPNVRLSECLECNSSTLQESDVCEHGTYPVYGANDIVGYLNNYNTEGEAVYIIKDGSGVGTVSYVEGKCSATGTLNTLQAKEGYSLQYLYYLLKVFNFEPYKTGMAIPHIYFKDYGKAKVFCPSYTEQLQYARLLSAIDYKLSIEQNILTELSLQKQYLLRQMFI